MQLWGTSPASTANLGPATAVSSPRDAIPLAFPGRRPDDNYGFPGTFGLAGGMEKDDD